MRVGNRHCERLVALAKRAFSVYPQAIWLALARIQRVNRQIVDNTRLL